MNVAKNSDFSTWWLICISHLEADVCETYMVTCWRWLVGRHIECKDGLWSVNKRGGGKEEEEEVAAFYPFRETTS